MILKQIPLMAAMLILSSCITTEYIKYAVVPKDPLDLKLLPLEKRNLYDQRFEIDMIDSNICDTGEVKYGFITYSGVGNHSFEKMPFWVDVLCIASLGTLSFFVPLAIMHTRTEVSYEIQNRNLEQVIKFSGSGKSRVPIRFLSRNKDFDSAYFLAFGEAHKEIRNQLSKQVVQKINEQLLEKGKINSQ